MRYHSTMNTIPRRLAALSCALYLAATSCFANNELPELGDPSGANLSLRDEKRIGQQIFHEIRLRDPDYLDDPEIQDYLNRLGNRLVAATGYSEIKFSFFPMNDPMINAFATFGGYVGVNTGLIYAAQSESELAGVLAHEISHVTQHHLARQIEGQRQTSIAAMVALALAVLAARSNSQVSSAAIASAQAGSLQSQLGFSRDFEREADRLGLQMLQRAGFDPHAMASFFQRLQQATRVYENNAPSYLRTHPLTVERISDMQNRTLGLPVTPSSDSPEFLLIQAKIRALRGVPSEAVNDIQLALREQKLPVNLGNYALAIAYLRGRDFANAEKAVTVARQAKLASPLLDRVSAEIALAKGDIDLGLSRYREALNRYPHTLSLLRPYVEALQRHKRAQDGLNALDAEKKFNTTEDLALLRLRAQLLADLGKRASSHRMQGEVYAQQQQLAAAIEQFEFAQRAADSDFYEMSIIDARLRELRRQLTDEMRSRNK